MAAGRSRAPSQSLLLSLLPLSLSLSPLLAFWDWDLDFGRSKEEEEAVVVNADRGGEVDVVGAGRRGRSRRRPEAFKWQQERASEQAPRLLAVSEWVGDPPPMRSAAAAHGAARALAARRSLNRLMATRGAGRGRGRRKAAARDGWVIVNGDGGWRRARARRCSAHVPCRTDLHHLLFRESWQGFRALSSGRVWLLLSVIVSTILLHRWIWIMCNPKAKVPSRADTYGVVDTNSE